MRKLNTKDLFNAIKVINKVGVSNIRASIEGMQKSGAGKEEIGMAFVDLLVACLSNAEAEVYAFIQNFLQPDQKAEELEIDELVDLYHEFMETNSKSELFDFFKKASGSQVTVKS